MKKNFKIILAAMLFFSAGIYANPTEQFFTVSAGHLKQ